MELADKMSFPSMAVTVDVNVVLVQLRYKKKKKKKKKFFDFFSEHDERSWL